MEMPCFTVPQSQPHAQRVLQEARGVLALLRGPIAAQLQGTLHAERSSMLMTRSPVPQARRRASAACSSAPATAEILHALAADTGSGARSPSAMSFSLATGAPNSPSPLSQVSLVLVRSAPGVSQPPACLCC